MRYFTILLSVALSASISDAQAGPGIVKPAAKSPVFDIAKPPFSSFGGALDAVSCQKLTVDPPGIYTVCLSVRSLASAYGGNNRRSGVLLGKYDIRTRTFSATTEASLLNDTTYHHFDLHIEPRDGLIAVCDRIDAASNLPIAVVLAVRTSATAAFQAGALIIGIQGTIGNGYDASIGRIGRVPHLFYQATINGQQGIWADALDLTTPEQPRAAGKPRIVVVNRPALYVNAHSPTPLAGPDGDVEGLWYAQRTIAGSSVMAFAEDLDPATDPLVTLGGPSFKNNGAIAGGTFFCADNGFVIYTALTEATGSWLLGDDETRGGTANFVAGATGGTTTQPVATVLFLGGGMIGATKLAGIHGALGILPSLLVVVGASVHNDDELATWSLQVPNDPGLAGKRFPVQGLSIGTKQPAAYAFTNTAWLSIR